MNHTTDCIANNGTEWEQWYNTTPEICELLKQVGVHYIEPIDWRISVFMFLIFVLFWYVTFKIIVLIIKFIYKKYKEYKQK